MAGIGMMNIKMKELARFIMVLSFVWLILVPMTDCVEAADYVFHVSGTGSDDLNDGSMGAPWRSIRKALSSIPSLNMTVDDNLVIYVGTGSYDMTSGETDAASDYELNTPNIAIKGAGSGYSIIYGSGMVNRGAGFTIAGANITITDLQFNGFSNSGVVISGVDNSKVLSCSFVYNGNGIRINGTTSDFFSEISGNDINGCSYDGIQVQTGAAASISIAALIKENNIYNCGSYGINMMAMYGGTLAVRVYGNKISGNTSYGIYMSANMGGILSPHISSNRIVDNSMGIYINSYDGTAYPVIRNNLIAGSQTVQGSCGIRIYPTMSGTLTPEIVHNTIDGGKAMETGIEIPDGVNVIPVIRFNIITNFSQYGINNLNTGTVDIDYNDVYGNTVQNFNGFDPAGTFNISVDPLFVSDFSIPDNSPCVDAISPTVEATLKVVAADDLIGTTRPRASASGQSRFYDMGCYEYPHEDYLFTMPDGLGLGTDYRLMTLPLSSLDGGSMLSAFESAFGPYDPTLWRIFAYVPGTAPAEYMEIGNRVFGEYFSSFHGRAFWVISRRAALKQPSHVFGGSNAANLRPFTIDLDPGWNLIALPWADGAVNTDIDLVNVAVKGQNSKYYLLDLENNLTQQGIWEYVATGYNELNNTTDKMKIGSGYWIYSFSSGNTLMIPPNNSGDYIPIAKRPNQGTAVKRTENKSQIRLTPPLPPGSTLTAEGGNGCFIGSLF